MVKRPPVFKRPALGKALSNPEAVRPSAAKRGYDRPWRAIRAAFLKAHPRCSCGAAATEVDHVVALRRGGTNAPSNLRAMCKRCHTRKTVAVDQARGERKNRCSLTTVDPCLSPSYTSTKSMFWR